MLLQGAALNDHLVVDFGWSFHGLSSLIQGWTVAKEFHPERITGRCHWQQHRRRVSSLKAIRPCISRLWCERLKPNSEFYNDLAIVNVRESPECEYIHVLAEESHGAVGQQNLNAACVSAAVTPGILTFLRIVIDHGIDLEMRRKSARAADRGNGRCIKVTTAA